MWRSQTWRKGRQILGVTRKGLATEAGGANAQSPPCPSKPPKRFGLLKFFGLTVPIASGGVVGYAWYDPEFRKQLEDNVPYTKELLSNVFPDTSPVTSTQREIKPAVPLAIEKATFLNVQENAASTTVDGKQVVPADQSSSSAGDSSSSTGLALEKQPAPEQKYVKDKIDPRVIESQLKSKEEMEKADNAALEVAINKLLDSSEKWTSESAKAQQEVATTTRNHTKLLKKAMDDTSDILHKDAQWESVAIAYKEREQAASRAFELTSEARRSVEKLKTVLEEGKINKVTKKNTAIFPATKKLNEMTKEMSHAASQIRQADAEAKVMLKYKDLVDKGRRQFQMELESLLPDVKLGNKSRKLTEDELNALIAHAHRRIEQLQKQIAEQLAMERQRLAISLDAQRDEDKGITEAALEDERSRLNTKFELDKQKMEMEFLVYQEEEVRKQLGRQAGAHSDHLKDVLSIQHNQLNAEFDRQLNMKLLEEREKFQIEVAHWISRLKGIEAAVDARAASEKLARTAQDLWLACIALNSAIVFGNEEEEMKPLKNEVDAVIKAGNKHPFVETVIGSVPGKALERGVHTEVELRDRFVKVSQISRRLGLITESNASLYKYIVSLLHSFFVVNNVLATSEKDLINMEELDNFKLVANAQYWMERGNLEMAVRFMCQLTGEPRKAAGDWIKEAKLLLETRQVAHVLTAYASATGLAATF